MPRANVFVSSTCYDLRLHRLETMAFIRDFGCNPIMFEAPDFAPNTMRPAPRRKGTWSWHLTKLPSFAALRMKRNL